MPFGRSTQSRRRAARHQTAQHATGWVCITLAKGLGRDRPISLCHMQQHGRTSESWLLEVMKHHKLHDIGLVVDGVSLGLTASTMATANPVLPPMPRSRPQQTADR